MYVAVYSRFARNLQCQVQSAVFVHVHVYVCICVCVCVCVCICICVCERERMLFKTIHNFLVSVATVVPLLLPSGLRSSSCHTFRRSSSKSTIAEDSKKNLQSESI